MKTIIALFALLAVAYAVPYGPAIIAAPAPIIKSYAAPAIVTYARPAPIIASPIITKSYAAPIIQTPIITKTIAAPALAYGPSIISGGWGYGGYGKLY